MDSCAKKLSIMDRKTCKSFCRRIDQSRLETLPGLAGGHRGVVDVDQAPACWELAIDLRFPAMSGYRLAVFSELGEEVPVVLGPGSFSVNMDGDVMKGQLAFGEHFAHEVLVDIPLYLLETVFITKRMDEGDFRRVPPDLRCQAGVLIIERIRVHRDEASNSVDVCSGRIALLRG